MGILSKVRLKRQLPLQYRGLKRHPVMPGRTGSYGTRGTLRCSRLILPRGNCYPAPSWTSRSFSSGRKTEAWLR